MQIEERTSIRIRADLNMGGSGTRPIRIADLRVLDATVCDIWIDIKSSAAYRTLSPLQPAGRQSRKNSRRMDALTKSVCWSQTVCDGSNVDALGELPKAY